VLIEYILPARHIQPDAKRPGGIIMATTAHKTKPYLTPQAYLDQERDAVTKREFHAGQVYAMSGASAAHNLVVTH